MSTSDDILRILPSTCDVKGDISQILIVELPSVSLWTGHLFGGQVFAQTVQAARYWLDQYNKRLVIHMVHGLFLKAGIDEQSVTYEVTPLRRGRTFQRLQVRAYQKKALVYQGMVSAQLVEDRTLVQHQQGMPHAPRPDGLMTDQELCLKITGQSLSIKEMPVEVRIATPEMLLQKKTADDRYGYWFRFVALISNTQLSFGQRQAFLGFVSDYGFLGGLFVPHSPQIRFVPFFLTSLDHSVWYYQDYKPFEWAYFEIESPVADYSRGLVMGRIYQESKLIAVAVQEGLLRRQD